jgi:hypothetical protein
MGHPGGFINGPKGVISAPSFDAVAVVSEPEKISTYNQIDQFILNEAFLTYPQCFTYVQILFLAEIQQKVSCKVGLKVLHDPISRFHLLLLMIASYFPLTDEQHC